jgi:hypothetical protein
MQDKDANEIKLK